MDFSFFVPVARAASASAPALAVLAVLAACAAPPPVAPRGFAAEAGGPVAAPGATLPEGERERQRRGVGLPPIVPPPGPVDRLPGALRAARPAPGTGPAGPTPSASLPVPANALSRMSTLPASPLANPPGGFSAGRP